MNALREKAIKHVVQQKFPKLKSRQSVTSNKLLVGKDQFSDVCATPKEGSRYRIEYGSDIFTGPSILQLPVLNVNEGKGEEKDKKQVQLEVPVLFKPQKPGRYTCPITLTCLDAADVRTITVEGLAISEGMKATLEFRASSRTGIVQEIPIINKSDDEWLLRVSLQGKGFSCPSSIVAKAKQVTMFPVTFSATKNVEVGGALTLTNSKNGQKHIYNLIGYGEGLTSVSQSNVDCACGASVSHVRSLFG